MRDEGSLHAGAELQQLEHSAGHTRVASAAVPVSQRLLVSDKRLASAVHAIEVHAPELISSLTLGKVAPLGGEDLGAARTAAAKPWCIAVRSPTAAHMSQHLFGARCYTAGELNDPQ